MNTRVRNIIYYTSIFVAIIICIITIIFSLYYYRETFNGTFSTTHEHWGQFGDYLGGLLNPLFGFLAFIALLYTIIIQRAELKNNENDRIERIEIEIAMLLIKQLLQEKEKVLNTPFPKERIDINWAADGYYSPPSGPPIKHYLNKNTKNNYLNLLKNYNPSQLDEIKVIHDNFEHIANQFLTPIENTLDSVSNKNLLLMIGNLAKDIRDIILELYSIQIYISQINNGSDTK